MDALTGAVTADPLAVTLSRADEAALEHGLRAAARWGGRVLTVCAGGASADPVLREAKARGSDIVRIPWTDGASGGPAPAGTLPGGCIDDERATARVVARAISDQGRPTLVVCGDRSADRGTGAFPAFLAHELGVAQVLGIVTLDMGGDRVEAERRLEGGRRERVVVPAGAVCSVEGAGIRLRRAPLAAALAAVSAVVPLAATQADPPDTRVRYGTPEPFRPRTRVVPPPTDVDPRQRWVSLAGIRAHHDPPVVHETDDAAEAADVLFAYLQRHGYLDPARPDAASFDPTGKPLPA